MINTNLKISIIGLGYVGLPLSMAFSKKYKVVGYDYDKKRIQQINENKDATGMFTNRDLIKKKNITFTSDDSSLANSDVFIITVPTPISKNRKPDLSSIISATKKVGKVIKKNNYIIYESTVYPGLTEEICVPILEKISKLKLNKNFYVGYSPERINPGDKKNNFYHIKKIVSGSNLLSLNFIDELYKSILKNGTFRAKSIKVAEAAKISENVQRDLNISLMNELSLIYSKLGIDTTDVLKAMKTKWNSLNFVPGLVGGHCISVDPYYLTYKSEKLGYPPKVIHSGRKVNEFIPKYIIKNLIKILNKRKKNFTKVKVGIFGLTFKENCKDFRNSKVIDMIYELKRHKLSVLVEDPVISKRDFLKQYPKIKFMNKNDKIDVLILAVPHNNFKKFNIKKITNFFKNKTKPILIDIKSIFNKDKLRKSGFIVWSL